MNSLLDLIFAFELVVDALQGFIRVLLLAIDFLSILNLLG